MFSLVLDNFTRRTDYFGFKKNGPGPGPLISGLVRLVLTRLTGFFSFSWFGQISQLELGYWGFICRDNNQISNNRKGELKFGSNYNFSDLGCTFVVASYQQYFENRAKVVFLLLESIDVYLLGTVMLVFGMGLYELFISNLDVAKERSEEKFAYRSNLFGLFTLKERPKWLEIKTVNELKTKLGHVIVMLLLIGLFEKSKKAAIQTPVDLLCFSASVLLCSGCLYLLSKLNGSD